MRPLLHIPRLRHVSLHPWLLQAPSQTLVPRRIATTSAQNAAPVDIPKLIIPHKSKDHNSLATFVEYATRTKLSPLRTYYVGTHYEYTTALSFMRLGFSLLRTGGRSDAGIDLIGHWVLAPLSEPLPVIIQCKVRKCSLGPGHVRELEGSFRGMPPDWKGKPVLGLLVTTLKATKGTMDAIGRSLWPMGFVMMSRQGLIQQFVWNRAASDRGLQGVGVTVRHTPRALLPGSEVQEEKEGEGTLQRKKHSSEFANTGTQKDIQLTWMGSPIFPERKTLDRETLDLIDLVAPEEHVEPPVKQIETPKRARGRPRRGEGKEKEKEVIPVIRLRKGPKPTKHHAPSPRGGQISRPRHPPEIPKVGRPKGAKNKVKISSAAD